MHREGQLEYVVSALKGMRKGSVARWNANRLIVTLFNQSEDLHNSRALTPPCLISLSFYPVRQDLTMVAIFRDQCTDTKGYGNLLSLAMILKQVSHQTARGSFILLKHFGRGKNSCATFITNFN